MKKLAIPFSPDIHTGSPFETISAVLDKQARQPVAASSWPDFDYRPEAAFAIAQGTDGIFIKYYVTEETARACFSQPNDPVYRDSCVEFFIAFDDERQYYNFECNCIGTCLVGYGPGRERERLPEDVIRQVRVQALLQRDPVQHSGAVYWEVTIAIPFRVFIHHELAGLRGRKGRANFYKCGDDLPRPHYLSWNPIDTEQPEFHMWRCFGEVSFE